VGLAWAREGGQLARIDLSVYEDNAAARHLYEQVGFEVEGRRADFSREPGGGPRPDLLMALSLRTA
jgi:ribosomal protein S18 acetylase RimI-like enzyme